MRTLALLIVALGSLAVAAEVSPPVPSGGQPILLRLEGRVQPSADAARAKGVSVASLGFLDGVGGNRFLGITKARTIGANQAVLAQDVLDALKPFDPNFLLTGPPELLEKVRGAPGGTRVVLEGLVDRGAHTYYLRDVRIG